MVIVGEMQTEFSARMGAKRKVVGFLCLIEAIVDGGMVPQAATLYVVVWRVKRTYVKLGVCFSVKNWFIFMGRYVVNEATRRREN